ncbi:DUF2231 domain-containing protein [Flavobacterium sp.]|uniref:DUF2231 domain-containing protein n=1 Tax=Flavobacterium sp. TaxID=239 RepID=UPI0025C558E2|nr:DUF2231 domain-containing protein [Flavobacterium sp.]
MNEAHIHMLVNHFPIIGLFFGLGVLLFGVVKKNLVLKSAAYVMLIICVISGQLAMMTGDKAEHFVEDLPGFTHNVIHEHEEATEAFMIPMYVLGLVSIVGLYAQSKKHSFEKWISYLALVLGVVCVFLSKNSGTTGGKIRHTEIRENSSTLSNSNTSSQVEEEENE